MAGQGEKFQDEKTSIYKLVIYYKILFNFKINI